MNISSKWRPTRVAILQLICFLTPILIGTSVSIFNPRLVVESGDWVIGIFNPEVREKTAMRHAMIQLEEAGKVSGFLDMDKLGRRDEKSLAYRNFVKVARTIDVSQCPKNFQMTFHLLMDELQLSSQAVEYERGSDPTHAKEQDRLWDQLGTIAFERR